MTWASSAPPVRPWALTQSHVSPDPTAVSHTASHRPVHTHRPSARAYSIYAAIAPPAQCRAPARQLHDLTHPLSWVTVHRLCTLYLTLFEPRLRYANLCSTAWSPHAVGYSSSIRTRDLICPDANLRALHHIASITSVCHFASILSVLATRAQVLIRRCSYIRTYPSYISYCPDTPLIMLHLHSRSSHLPPAIIVHLGCLSVSRGAHSTHWHLTTITPHTIGDIRFTQLILKLYLD